MCQIHDELHINYECLQGEVEQKLLWERKARSI